MGIRNFIIKTLGGNVTNMSPNSLANLKQNRINSPSQDTEPRRHNDEDFIDKLMKYESWREKVYSAEVTKRKSIAEEILATLPEEDDDTGDDTNAEKMILELLSKFSQGEPQQEASWTAVPQAVMQAQAQTAMRTDEDLQNILTAAEREYPRIIKDVRKGKYSESEAVSFLGLKGIAPADAKRLYELAIKPE